MWNPELSLLVKRSSPGGWGCSEKGVQPHLPSHTPILGDSGKPFFPPASVSLPAVAWDGSLHTVSLLTCAQYPHEE